MIYTEIIKLNEDQNIEVRFTNKKGRKYAKEVARLWVESGYKPKLEAKIDPSAQSEQKGGDNE